MSLYNIESESSALVATGSDGYAESKPLDLVLPTPPDLTENLVAHYLLNNNADDCYGNYNGVITTSGGSIDFQGDKLDGIKIHFNAPANVSALIRPTLTSTVSFWKTGSSHPWIFSHHNPSGYGSIGFDLIKAQSEDSFYSTLQVIRYQSTHVITYLSLPSVINIDEELHNYVFCFNGDDTVTIYIDSESLGTSSTSSWSSFNFSVICGHYLGEIKYSNNVISNVRYYNSTKDQAFMDDLFAEGYYPKSLTEPTTDGLIAHYPLTGTAEDTTGNFDGTENGVTYVDDAEFGSITDAVGGITSANSLYTPVELKDYDEYLYCYWAKLTAAGLTKAHTAGVGEHRDLETTGNYGISNHFQMNSSSHFVGVTLGDGGDGYKTNYLTYNFPVKPTVDDWIHVAISQKVGEFGKLYVNGALVKTATSNYLHPTTVFPFYIGGWDNFNTSYTAPSYFSDVRVYNRRLLEQEITDIYNYEKNFRAIDIDDGLVAFYPLANNSLDNYYNEYNGIDTDISYDGESASPDLGSSKLRVGTFEWSGGNSAGLWFYPTTQTSTVISTGVYGSTYADIWWYANRVEFWRSSTKVLVLNFDIPLNQWSHIMVSMDGLDVNYYVDGIIVNSGTKSAEVYASDENSVIFSIHDGASTYSGACTACKASKARFYDRALSSEEIQAIYDQEDMDNHTSIKLKNIEADYNYENISISDTVDILKTDSPIQDGDNLIIVKEDNSINETVASGVTGTGPYQMDTTSVTQGEIPSRVFTVDSKVSFDNTQGYEYPVETVNDYIYHGPGDLTENLVAHYLLNNNSNDCAGTYDGTDTSMTYTGDAGDFNGTSSNITIPASFEFNLAPYTISLWLNLNTIDHIYQIMRFQTNDSNICIRVNEDNFIEFKQHNSSASLLGPTSTEELSINTLYHVVQVWDGSNIHGYINANAPVSASVTSMRSYNTPIREIGKYETSGYEFDGNISNVRIYSDVKDQSFIDDLFAEGYYPKPLHKPTTNGLIAHYPLTGTAEDATGNYDGGETGTVDYIDDDEYGSVLNVVENDDIYVSSNIENLSGQSFSVSSWIKLTEDDEADTFWGIGSIKATREIIHIGKRATNNYIYFGFYEDDMETTTPITSSNGFINILASFDYATRTQSLFIDGILILSRISDGVPDVNNNCILGRRHGNADTGYKGSIRNVRIYNRILTQQEITDIYNYEKNFRSIDIDNGLVAFYPLKNNSLDNYYNEYDGTDTDVTYDGDSGVFNGTNSYITTPYNPDTTNGITLSMWVDLTEDEGYHCIINGYESGKGGWIDLIVDAQDAERTMAFSVRNNAENGFKILIEVSDGEEILDTGLHHISATWDGLSGSTAYLSVDNIIRGSEVAVEAGSVCNNTASHRIGGHLQNTHYVNGKISNFRIYDRALSAEEITVIYDTENLDDHIIDPILSTTRAYSDINISEDNLVTKVELKSIGDKCLKVSADVV